MDIAGVRISFFAVKNKQKLAIFSMRAVSRSDFQTILTAFPTFTHDKWKMAFFWNKPRFIFENRSTGTFSFSSLKTTCPSCVRKCGIFKSTLFRQKLLWWIIHRNSFRLSSVNLNLSVNGPSYSTTTVLSFFSRLPRKAKKSSLFSGKKILQNKYWAQNSTIWGILLTFFLSIALSSPKNDHKHE